MKIKRPLSNLHTHTNFSDGSSSLEEQIRAAISCGFVSLGISDHSHCPLDSGSMRPGTEDAYLSQIKELAEQYSGKLELYAGLELDSVSECDTSPYEYVIGSAHFARFEDEYLPVDLCVDAQRKAIDKYFGGDEIGFVKAYYDELIRHVKDCKPDIVGHFDLLTKFESIDESNEEYRRIAIDALREIMKTCTRFEINTGGMSRANKRTVYPAPFLLEEICKLGGTVTVGSDCHNTRDMDYAFDYALRVAAEAGFTSIDRFTKNGFVQDEICLDTSDLEDK